MRSLAVPHPAAHAAGSPLGVVCRRECWAIPSRPAERSVDYDWCMTDLSQHDHNRRAWDRLARNDHRFSKRASAEELAKPLETVDGYGWLGPSIRGQRVLCLASGGGRQGPLYAAAGAEVVVVDISAAQLEVDREVAADSALKLRTVESSMDDLSMFADGSFDLVIHPVSTCYVPDVTPVFREVARVTRAGGLYVSQHKTPTSLQTSFAPVETRTVEGQGSGYVLQEPYYREEALPPAKGDFAAGRFREEGTQEYVHRWESLLGGMTRAGFVIEDFVEPHHAEKDAEVGSFGHRCQFVAPYMRIKARRVGASDAAGSVWTP